MPCYTPPPPNDRERQENAFTAIKLLCELVGNRIACGSFGLPVSKEILDWYIEHRKIDIDTINYYYSGNKKYEPDIQKAHADIEAARKLLES